MGRRSAAVGAVILAALLGCEDEPTASRGLPLCASPVEVTVSAGLTPTFGWSPACRVTVLEVRDADQDFPVWSLFAGPGERAIVPGVRYGEVPLGVLLSSPDPAPSLEAGTSYVLILTTIEIFLGEREVAREEFTP